MPIVPALRPSIAMLVQIVWLAGTFHTPDAVSCDALVSSTGNPFYCAAVFATDLLAPQGVVVTSSGDVLVLDCDISGGSPIGIVSAFWDADNDGFSGEGRGRMRGKRACCPQPAAPLALAHPGVYAQG